MTRRKRRNHSPEFKAKVAIAAPEGRQDAGRIGAAVRCASEPDHRLEDPVGGTLGGGLRRQAGQESGPDLQTMQAKIGQLTLENDF